MNTQTQTYCITCGVQGHTYTECATAPQWWYGKARKFYCGWCGQEWSRIQSYGGCYRCVAEYWGSDG